MGLQVCGLGVRALVCRYVGLGSRCRYMGAEFRV